MIKITSKKAFTIIELLVAITIVAIVAFVSFVGYTGVSQKANTSKSKSEITNASTQIKLYFSEYGVYPNSINSCPTPAVGSICVNNVASIVGYTVSGDKKGYCVASTVGTSTYYMTSNAVPTPTVGDCNQGATASMASQQTSDYTTAGAYTFTVPANVTLLHLENWGAQGGSGGDGGTYFGGAGGYGTYTAGMISVQPGDTLDLTVGALGTKGSQDAQGGRGGNSRVIKSGATLLSSDGGYGGYPATTTCILWGGYWGWDDWEGTDIWISTCDQYAYAYTGTTGNSAYWYESSVDGVVMDSSRSAGTRTGAGRILITYTPGEQFIDYSSPVTTTLTVNDTQQVRFEVWGGQGGLGGTNYGVNGGQGGGGGFARGKFNATAGDVLNIVVGAKGTDAATPVSGTAGSESYIKKSTNYLLRGYGGNGGLVPQWGCVASHDEWDDYYGEWYSVCDVWGWVVAGQTTGGSGWVNTTYLTNTTTATNIQGGNGRIRVLMQLPVVSGSMTF